MSPITITFADGTILPAADLNTLKNAINTLVSEVNAKAEQTQLNQVLTKVNTASSNAASALSAANSANSTARIANQNANDAVASAQAAFTSSESANAKADEAITGVEILEAEKLTVLPITIVNNVTYRRETVDSYIGIAYDKAIKRYLFLYADGTVPKYYASAVGSDKIFNSTTDLCSNPKNNIIFKSGSSVYVGYGEDLYELNKTAIV